MTYQIGPWQFVLNRCVLCSGSIERELDPLLVKLLIHFIAKPKEIVARQELVEEVWKQNFVDDNAINRAISELRKQLAHPSEKAPLLKTHYRKGYSLTVAVSLLPDVSPQLPVQSTAQQAPEFLNVENDATSIPQSNEASQETNKNQRTLLLSLLVIVLAGLVWFGFIWLHQPIQSPNAKQLGRAVEAKITANTWSLGSDLHPEMSTDRRFLAYTNIPPNRAPWRSFVKRIEDQREIEIEYPGYNVSVLSWQLKKSKVLVLATNLEQKLCEIVLIDVSNFPLIGNADIIKRCDLRYQGFAQLDEKAEYLYYTQFVTGSDSSGLYRYDLQRKKEFTIVPPSGLFFGITMPRLSFSGKKLAYISNRVDQAFSVFIYNLDTRESTRIFQAQKEVMSFAFDWLPNDEGMIISEGDRLSTVMFEDNTLDTVKIRARASGAVFYPWYIAAYAKNNVFYSTRKTQRYSLLRISDLFDDIPELTELYESIGSNRELVEVIKDEELAHLFVSDRSGSEQLWLAKDNFEFQISQFEDPNDEALTLSGIKVSPNKQRILLRVAGDIFFFDIDSSKLIAIPELKGRTITSYIWSQNNESILYVAQENSKSVFAELNLMTREISTFKGGNPVKLISGADGTTYTITERQLMRLSDERVWRLPVNIDAARYFVIANGYLYFTDGISRFVRFDLQGSTFQDVHIDFSPLSFSITNDGEMLFSNADFINTQILQLTWSD